VGQNERKDQEQFGGDLNLISPRGRIRRDWRETELPGLAAEADISDSQDSGICVMPPLRTAKGRGVRLLPLQRENFVLDAEFLALQIVHRLLIWQGTVDFLIESAFEQGMLLAERLDAILHRHG
jgi:hypothetical protein